MGEGLFLLFHSDVHLLKLSDKLRGVFHHSRYGFVLGGDGVGIPFRA
jgi:hypothetical protein